MFARHSKVLNKEKTKIAGVQSKEASYKAQLTVLHKEIKNATKEVYEWEKKAVATGTDVEKCKERNQEIMLVVQLVKKDPSIIEKVASGAGINRKNAKQIYQ